MNKKVNLAIFASGNGTNAENIVKYFNQKKNISVVSVYVNNEHAGVIERMNRLNIPITVFHMDTLYQSSFILDTLIKQEIDFIVLAGFLKWIPINIIDKFVDRIINIHPALLPKYGGKGMYGEKVHEQVIQHHETISGISIHTVNSEYDKGIILFQATCPVSGTDTPETLALKIHPLEYFYYPLVIEAWITSKYPD